MNKYISENAKIQAQRNEYFKQHLAAKQQKEAAKYDKIMHVQQLARECGVEETNQKMWYAMHMICSEESNMVFFIGTTTVEGRLAFIEEYARVNNLI